MMSLFRSESGMKVSEFGGGCWGSHRCIMAERDDNGCPKVMGGRVGKRSAGGTEEENIEFKLERLRYIRD
jgi:hypothetical protein